MRTRWRWQWQPRQPKADVLFFFFLIWLVLGGCCFGIVGIATESDVTLDHNAGLTAPGWVALVVWLGPLALEGIGVGLCYIVKGIRWLLHHPPMRRVTEPLPDLRQRSD